MLLSSFLPFRSLSLPLLADVSMKCDINEQITIKTAINTDQNQKPMRMGKRRSNRIVPRVESRNCWINVGRSKSWTPGCDGASHRPSCVEAMAAPAPLATVSPSDGTPLGCLRRVPCIEVGVGLQLPLRCRSEGGRQGRPQVERSVHDGGGR